MFACACVCLFVSNCASPRNQRSWPRSLPPANSKNDDVATLLLCTCCYCCMQIFRCFSYFNSALRVYFCTDQLKLYISLICFCNLRFFFLFFFNFFVATPARTGQTSVVSIFGKKVKDVARTSSLVCGCWQLLIPYECMCVCACAHASCNTVNNTWNEQVFSAFTDFVVVVVFELLRSFLFSSCTFNESLSFLSFTIFFFFCLIYHCFIVFVCS